MTRRDLLQSIGFTIAARGLLEGAPVQQADTLHGTAPLTWEGDLSKKMLDGAHRYVERKIAESIQARQRHWARDVSSPNAYEKSVRPNRLRFSELIGAVDERVPVVMQRFGDDDNPALIAETASYRVYQVSWAVLDGVFGEGLLLEPKSPPQGYVVALSDADQTPEHIVGLVPGPAPEHQFARRLAENGFEVVVPVLISRETRWSGHPEIRMTDQTHREWIYRQAFHMGRHIIGYEVQKVLAATDWLRQHSNGVGKIGVAGYGEGGLIAFYAAAIGTDIDVALVSGYFDSRQDVWSEPIYRNVWGLLREFGDAELATLIAPRGLIVEYSNVPDVADQKGDLKTPTFERVNTEFHRINTLINQDFGSRQLISGDGDAPIGPGSPQAMAAFAQLMGGQMRSPLSRQVSIDQRRSFGPGERQTRQVQALERHVQSLVRASEHVREEFFLYKLAPKLADETWSQRLRHKTFSTDDFEAATWYRRHFQDEVLGRFDEPLLPANARTRRIYNSAKWEGYEVVLDVWPDVFAWGILLLPKDLKSGERRPVVICQHGRNGLPREVVEGKNEAYRNFAARLADQGFIVFAPHNLYRGEDRYRWLSRKTNGVKASLFSFIVSQHEQILRWLKTLPMVDGKRIAFYGLSYGGETAMRVPAILQDYSLSICSGDFNSWTRKVAATDQRFSFMYTIEWEMPYFNMGSTFDYAELAYLIFPRPFMVERGHHDLAARDQWVAYEYAKVRWLYAQFGLADKTDIEYYNGGHTINGEGTFRFLRKHLNWPG